MLHSSIEQRLRHAVVEVVPDVNLSDIHIQPCPDAKFGDYQTNALMSVAKALRKNPRQLATDVLKCLNVADICEFAEIAGAGYINFKLKDEALAAALAQADGHPDKLLGIRCKPRTFVIDFSSPNTAKPMHVGHIRSTVLGESIARTLRFLGHRVIKDNHIGDWGTQFGKLIVGWRSILRPQALKEDPMGEMERLYKSVSAECEANPETLALARQELKTLQEGDAANLSIWNEMTRWSMDEFERMYGRLGVQFDHTLGESFYNSRLKGVVDDLVAQNIARESEGAIVVFFEDSTELKDHPALVRKSDGAANYTTTDLATVAYRLETWSPDEIVYVTDGRQQLHFKQLFAICQKWLKSDAAPVKLTHVWFGSILGEDGKPFRTRSGETVSLEGLLDEAEERALAVVTTKNPDLSENDRREIARVVGIGAIKYADLLPNRQSDSVFNWEKMLSFNGNTAPYLQYAYARVMSLFRKMEPVAAQDPASPFSLSHPDERRLAAHLLNFGLVIKAVAGDYRPNYLCTYLFELAGHFARFYEACPVLKAEAAQRESRLLLCRVTGQVLKQGLDLLGIETVDRM